MRCRMLVVAGSLAALACMGASWTAAAVATSPSCPSVTVWDTMGSGDPAAWVPLGQRGTPVGDVVMDNGLARVTHKVPAYPNQTGFHHLQLWRGGSLMPVTSPSHGDYTYWSRSVTNDGILSS